MNDKLIRYSIQIAMLKQLLSRKLISDKEYSLVKQKIMKEYKIISDITS
ncbi:conjugal transfer protein [Listeria innocua]|nr:MULTISPECIES: SHOCT domain-containing protein [Bacilli]EAD5717942.1 conjugal transfer protein [Listeria innocua]EAF7006025.1 conjugal transfer protein [Listeria monocytogenes]EAH3615166.1 conjugal transfer protein [Listeria monocytogenes]EHL7151042.1 conjugal transfer protein [Listeria monocytogenes]EHL7151301.1 conjugal transfer protein [Listeria monocytogenes]